MTSIFTLLFLVSVGQVFCQTQPTAGSTSLVGVITGGLSNENPAPSRWIEFQDRENKWSTLGSGFTVETWIWHSTQGEASWQPILSRHPGQNSPRNQAHFSIAMKDHSTLEVRAGCGCSENGTECGDGFVLSAGNFTVESWQHVAVTFDGDGLSESPFTQIARLYVNGVEIDFTTWGEDDVQCQGRGGQWSNYGDLKIGFFDDEATNTANQGNPNFVYGWWGRIDEIRFWEEARSVRQIGEFHDVGLKGSEPGLFAYYTFTPAPELLEDEKAYKYITNSASDDLHGLPFPNPADGSIFGQEAEANFRVDSFSTIFGQSDAPDLPSIPNKLAFQSWPGSPAFYTVISSSYSPALQNLIDTGVASIMADPEDPSSVTVYVTCPENDCSDYTENWKDYFLEYTATYEVNPTEPARMYLRILTNCPAGDFDECGTCGGDNSVCQCVVYHSFESERMSYVLLQWSLHNMIEEASEAVRAIESTERVLDMTETPDYQLRAQIEDIMTFYNGDLTDYCGYLNDFMSEVENSVTTGTEAMSKPGAPSVDGTLPYIPNYYTG